MHGLLGLAIGSLWRYLNSYTPLYPAQFLVHDTLTSIHLTMTEVVEVDYFSIRLYLSHLLIFHNVFCSQDEGKLASLHFLVHNGEISQTC